MKWRKWSSRIDRDRLELAQEFLVYGYAQFKGRREDARIFQAVWNGENFVTHYAWPKELVPIYFIRVDSIPIPGNS